MSNTVSNNGTSDIRDRLKSAAEIEPAKLPRLQSIAEETAEELTLALNRLSLSKVNIKFREFEVTQALDAEDPDQTGNLVASLSSKRFGRPAYLSAPRSLTEACIAFFFGATPSESAEPRDITELDKALVLQAFNALLDSFANAFAPIDDGAFKLGRFVEPHEYEEHFGSGSEVRNIQLTFDLRLNAVVPVGKPEPAASQASSEDEDEEPMTSFVLALPFSYLSLHRRKLAEPIPAPQPLPDESWSDAMVRSFEKSGLHLQAVLVRKQLPLSEIAHLRVGQTLALGVGVTEPITLECDGKPIFKSQVGFSRGSYVARFEEVVDPTQEFIDDILSD